MYRYPSILAEIYLAMWIWQRQPWNKPMREWSKRAKPPPWIHEPHWMHFIPPRQRFVPPQARPPKPNARMILRASVTHRAFRRKSNLMIPAFKRSRRERIPHTPFAIIG